MKTIKFIFAITLFFSFTFSISAQTPRPKQTEVVLDQEPAQPGRPISNIPACFCCNEKIFQLQQPTINGEDLICKDKKNVFNTIKCEGASINWTTSPSAVTFTGQGTSSIQLDYSSIPVGTTAIVISVQIRCGNRVVSSKIEVKVCKQQVKVLLTEGQDALLHCLDKEKKNNFGTYKANMVSNWTYNGIPAVTSFVIKFNLPADLVNGSQIVAANLKLVDYCEPSSGGNNLYTYSLTSKEAQSGLYVRRITSAWSHDNVSCGDAPTTTETSKLTIPAYVGPVYPANSDNLSIPVAALMTGSLTNHQGFKFDFQDTNPSLYYRARSWGSFDNPVASKRPVLELIYNP